LTFLSLQRRKVDFLNLIFNALSRRLPTSASWDLIESQFRHLMRVAVSVREGAISSSTLLKRLRSGSKKNATYTAFREVGRVIRTVQLLRYLSDAPLRRRVTAARPGYRGDRPAAAGGGLDDRAGGPGSHLAVSDRAHQSVR
jgi:hypothetical protein